MNFLFLIDPLETVVAEKDTSFMLMEAAHRRGHKIFYLPNGGMSSDRNNFSFRATPVVPQRKKALPFDVEPECLLPAEKVDVIFVRNDPPFNERYLVNTWILDRLPKRIVVVNRSSSIRTVNEKLWCTQFADLMPRTLISSHRAELDAFLREERTVVVKPTNGHGGRAIFILSEGDVNTSVTLETLTSKYTEEILMQAYIPEAQEGDKRVLLLNGEPLGAMLRLHGPDDHRNNLFTGATAKPSEITDADLKIVNVLKPHLKELGLYFVGIDILGGKLIEVNVTSPTCLQELVKFSGEAHDASVIEFVEGLASVGVS